MKFIRIIPATAIRKIYLVVAFIVLSLLVFAQTPSTKIQYVGSVSINPCQDPKVLADWYAKFGIETKEYKGGYYAKIDTAAGPLFFGIHPKKADAPKQCASSVTVTYRVENFESSLAALKSKGLVPYKTEKEPSEGQFAYFHDPDGNEVNIWGK